MKWAVTKLIGAGIAAAALAATLTITPAHAASERSLFVSVSGATRAPIGWTEFCAEYAGECET
jgi:predicted transglutaminase-like cysteine proteinase